MGTWTVLAICSDEETCALLDFLAGLGDEKTANKILADLKNYVPNSMPADWVRREFSESLTDSDGILEFRWPKKKGPTPRVLWFYDEGKLVVCSHGCAKKGSMSAAEIDRAKDWKRRYQADRDAKRLTIVTLEAFADDQDGE